MPKPEIIGSAQSTYTRVVRMVCEEKGIEDVLTETLCAGRSFSPFA
jgi:glutathione S-transferase